MNLSISNLEQLSGVSVHTIRIWERRYNALTPLRSAGNTRFYTDEHLKRLLDIVSLNQSGMKISQACSLSTEEVDRYLEHAIQKTISGNVRYEYYVSQLLKAGLAYNEHTFIELLESSIKAYGIRKAYLEIMYPLLQRLGLMWRRDHICPGQEHFISAIIRQKLMVAIDRIPLANQSAPTWMLFLPEDEAHDIPLLFANFMLRSNGFRVCYLGDSVPFASLKDAYINTKIDHLLFFMIRQRPVQQANEYLDELNSFVTGSSIFIAGNTSVIEGMSLQGKAIWFKSISEFQQLIEPIANAG